MIWRSCGAALLVLIGFPLSARAVTFEPAGPPGGYIESMAPDPGNPRLWYVVSNSILFRSTDAGQSWTSIWRDAATVSVQPQTSHVFLFANDCCGQDQLLRSTDAGATFVRLVRNASQRNINNIRFDFRNPSNLFGFAGSGSIHDLMISADGGSNWIPAVLPYKRGASIPGPGGTCRVEGYEFADVLASPLEPGTAYGSAMLDRICPDPQDFGAALLLVSRDAGKTWSTLESVDDGIPARFSFDMMYPDRAFAYDQSGIRRLTAKGWVKISNLQTDRLISVAGSSTELIALQNPRLQRSTDLGTTWSAFAPDIRGIINDIEPAGDQPGNFFGASNFGIYRWAPGWKRLGAGLPGTTSHVISYDAAANILYAAPSILNAGLLFRSTDRGASWQDLTYRILEGAVVRIWTDPLRSGYVLANQFQEFRLTGFTSESTDGGQTWKATHRNAQFVGADPNHVGVAYFTDPRNQKLYKSAPDGTLAPLPLRLPPMSIAISSVVVDPKDSNSFFVVAGDLYHSADGGGTFIKVSGLPRLCFYCGPEITSLVALNARRSFLALSSTGRVYQTNDSGAHWQYLSKVPAERGLDSELKAADPLGQHLFCTSRHALFESVDAGRTWKRIPVFPGMPIVLGRTVSVHQITDPSIVPWFVATSLGVGRAQ